MLKLMGVRFKIFQTPSFLSEWNTPGTPGHVWDGFLNEHLSLSNLHHFNGQIQKYNILEFAWIIKDNNNKGLGTHAVNFIMYNRKIIKMMLFLRRTGRPRYCLCAGWNAQSAMRDESHEMGSTDHQSVRTRSRHLLEDHHNMVRIIH